MTPVETVFPVTRLEDDVLCEIRLHLQVPAGSLERYRENNWIVFQEGERYLPATDPVSEFSCVSLRGLRGVLKKAEIVPVRIVGWRNRRGPSEVIYTFGRGAPVHVREMTHDAIALLRTLVANPYRLRIYRSPVVGFPGLTTFVLRGVPVVSGTDVKRLAVEDGTLLVR